jgi:hypothetical protein
MIFSIVMNEKSKHNHKFLLFAVGQPVNVKQMLAEGNLDGAKKQR